MIELKSEHGRIWCEDPDSAEKLRKNHFGQQKDGKILLFPEEAMYLVNFQNARIDGIDSFSQLCTQLAKNNHRLFVKYNAYRDWRDRGLVVLPIEAADRRGRQTGMKKYPQKSLETRQLKAKALWFTSSKFGIIEDRAIGKELFEGYWIGQLGVYKQSRGSILAIDFLETLFLMKHFGLEVTDCESGKKISHSQLLKQLSAEREYAKQLNDVYENWRLSGYVVKTGFKFGNHFRIYFPGASPAKGGEWTHSKHVLHVFPKEQKMLISEWARIVRVAHSVKKTFILAIPKLAKSDFVDYHGDYAAYRRKKAGSDWVRENPEDGARYLMRAVLEDEHIGGVELSSLLREAQESGLELILSITDRETSVTYYVMKRIDIGESDYEYYEIEWLKP